MRIFGQDNVVSCRAVLPGGEVREFRGDQGTTGLITEVTIRLSL